jgi:hypothetical protein
VSPFRPFFPPQPAVFPQPFDLLTIPSLRRTPRFPRFHQLTNPSLPPSICNPPVISRLQIPLFATPLFSHRYKTTGVSGYFCLAVHESQVTSHKPRPFIWLPPLCSPLCALFRTPFLCFQPFAASFAKTPGWGGSHALAESAVGPPRRHTASARIRISAFAVARVRWIPVNLGTKP